MSKTNCIALGAALIIILFSTIRFAFGNMSVIGDIQIQPTREQQHLSYFITGKTTDGWGWASQKWDGDDKPYAAIRDMIDNRIAAGESPELILQQYILFARKSPTDPKAEFTYGYAAWRVATDQVEPTTVRNAVTLYVPNCLAKAAFPNTYDYARLRFLIQMKTHYDPQLIGVGEKLLAKFSNDHAVRIQYIAALTYSRIPKNLDSALIIANTMIRQNPSDPFAYAQRANIYAFMSILNHHNRQDYELAIEDLQKCVQLDPPNYTGRADMQRGIESMQRALDATP